MADFFPLVLNNGVHKNIHGPDALVCDILKLGGAAGTVTSTLAILASQTLAAPAAGSVWDGLRVEASTLTAKMGAGNVTIAALAATHHYQPTITTAGGVGLLTVTDAYTMYVDAPPVGAGAATLTNAWSLGVVGAVQLLSKLVIMPAAVSSGTFSGLTQVGAAHTNLTAGTEVPDTNFNLSATKTWATGAIATQRDFLIQARTYAFAAASIVTTGATVAIAGAPTAGANATITSPLAFWVQGGYSSFASRVGINTTTPANLLEVDTVVSSAMGAVFQCSSTNTVFENDWETVALCNDNNATPNNFVTLGFCTKDGLGNRRQGAQIIGYYPNHATGHIDAGLVFRVRGNNVNQEVFRCQVTGNMTVGTTTDFAATQFQVLASKTVASATGAAWDGIKFSASTLTLSGATTPIATMSFFKVAGPTITADSTVVTTDFFTCRIGAATFTGAGPASATRNWALGVDGNTLFAQAWACTPNAIVSDSGGGQVAGVTTVNTEITTDGDANLDNVPLANGAFIGQVRNIYCKAQGAAGDSFKITPATFVQGTQITFAAPPKGKGAGFVWTSVGWVCFANNGGAIT